MTSEPVVGDANTGERQDEPPALPAGGLLALALAGFITILTETLAAGLLPTPSTRSWSPQPAGHPHVPKISRERDQPRAKTAR